jgi:probable HAF family extracellular repeat protein
LETLPLFNPYATHCSERLGLNTAKTKTAGDADTQTGGFAFTAMTRRRVMKSTRLAGISGALLSLFCTLTVFRAQTIAQTKKEHQPRYKVVDLGTLGGSISQAFGINNRGDVVGFATTAGDVSLHAFPWRDGLMADLGTLGAPYTLPYSIAVSINNSGKVVGNSETSIPDPFGENFCGDFLICRPVVWEISEITALPALGGTNGGFWGKESRRVG